MSTIQVPQHRLPVINNEQTNVVHDRSGILGIRFHGPYVDPLPIQICFVWVSRASIADCLPPRKSFAWNEARGWEDPVAATYTLQYTQSFPKEIVGDRSIIEGLIG